MAMRGSVPPSRRCERRVRWSEEPEMEAWMLEHDKGRPAKAVSEDFRAAFGFGLTPVQVTGFRQSHGTTVRAARCCGEWRERPVGSESVGKDGYIKVKVREKAEVPGSKDNWEFKHHLVWKRAHGTDVPEGCDIMFADGDMRNFDPSNLVAAPRRLRARLKAYAYWDAESLEAAIAMCELDSAAINAKSAHRVCRICGRRFSEDERRRRTRLGRTACCPDCIRKRAWFEPGAQRRLRRPKGRAVCAVCGGTFERTAAGQRRCPGCIDERPKLSVGAHARTHRKEKS